MTILLTLIIGILIGCSVTAYHIRTTVTKTHTTFIYSYPYPCVDRIEVSTSIVMPDVKGIINEPQVQNVIAMLVIMMIVVKTIIEVKI